MNNWQFWTILVFISFSTALQIYMQGQTFESIVSVIDIHSRDIQNKINSMRNH